MSLLLSHEIHVHEPAACSPRLKPTAGRRSTHLPCRHTKRAYSATRHQPPSIQLRLTTVFLSVCFICSLLCRYFQNKGGILKNTSKYFNTPILQEPTSCRRRSTAAARAAFRNSKGDERQRQQHTSSTSSIGTGTSTCSCRFSSGAVPWRIAPSFGHIVSVSKKQSPK